MYIDRIDLVLPGADITSVLSALAYASGTLEPLLLSVSTADRKRYAKLGLKNEALALQIIEVGRANPDLIPRGIDFEKIDRDLVAREQLRTLKILLDALLGRVNDSMLLTGVDIYAAALSIYHCLRRNADTTSLKETVDELKKGFARPSRKKKQAAEAAPATAPASEALKTSPSAEHRTPEAVPLAAAPAMSRSVPAAPEGSAPLPSVSLMPRRVGTTPAFHISFDQGQTFLMGGVPIPAAGHALPELAKSGRGFSSVPPSGVANVF